MAREIEWDRRAPPLDDAAPRRRVVTAAPGYGFGADGFGADGFGDGAAAGAPAAAGFL